MPQATEYKCIQPLSGGKPKQIVLFLHGYGANGADLLPLGFEWQKSLPDAVFVAPDAIEPCEVSPVGFQWFSLGDWSPHYFEQGVRHAGPQLDKIIDAVLAEFGLGEENMALVGFSQGTMISLYSAPRRKKKLAGVLGYSGALLAAEDLVNNADKFQKPPVLLVHGDADDVVSPENTQAAQSVLEHCGFEVDSLICPGLGHGIDGAGVKAGDAFLKRVFGLS